MRPSLAAGGVGIDTDLGEREATRNLEDGGPATTRGIVATVPVGSGPPRAAASAGTNPPACDAERANHGRI